MSDMRFLLDKIELKSYELNKTLREIKNTISGLSFLAWNIGFMFALGYAHCESWGVLNYILVYFTGPVVLGRVLAHGAEALCK